MRLLSGLAVASLASAALLPLCAPADGASSSTKGLILVLANRQWEVEHLVRTLAKKAGRPEAIDGASMQFPYHPYGATGSVARRPRSRFRCDGYAVEVWCIEDLTRSEPSAAKLSRQKWDMLPFAFAGEGADPKEPRRPSVVVSFGSCAGDPKVAANGSVVIGSDVFVHDLSLSSKDPWYGQLDRLVPGSSAKLLLGIDSVRQQVEPGFGKPPVTTGQPRLLSADELVALSDVDVGNTKDYSWADPATVSAFHAKVKHHVVGSMDTAQGLVRLRTRDLTGDSPFVYVSGILNRIGKFSDVDQDPKKQTATVMTNAAQAALWLLPELTGGL